MGKIRDNWENVNKNSILTDRAESVKKEFEQKTALAVINLSKKINRLDSGWIDMEFDDANSLSQKQIEFSLGSIPLWILPHIKYAVLFRSVEELVYTYSSHAYYVIEGLKENQSIEEANKDNSVKAVKMKIDVVVSCTMPPVKLRVVAAIYNPRNFS